MDNQLTIRQETRADIEAITRVTMLAFESNPHSEQTEHLLVERLRNQGALEISLVAELAGKVVGHIAFSKVTIGGAKIGWYGLAPVSVEPCFQNQGIGSQLITKGLSDLKQQGAKGCVLLGEPEYYSRFGFKVIDNLTLQGVPPEYFMSLSFDGVYPSGDVEYHSAFSEN